MNLKLPRLLRFSIVFLLGFLTLGLIVRGAFYFAFSAGAEGVEQGLIAKSFVLGVRYDLRLGLLVLLPFLVLAGFERLSPFANGTARRLWVVYFSAVATLLVLFHLFDFAHYAYLATKLAASVLNFLEDPRESAAMVWQTYPVIRLVLLWIVLSTLLALAVAWLLRRIAAAPAWQRSRRPRLQAAVLSFVCFVPVTLGVHGKFSQYPLRWSDAYFTPNPFVAALALNPVLNFYDTRKYVGGSYSLPAVQDAYPRMAAYLGVDSPDGKSLDYGRIASPKANAVPGQPNIVLVLMESFSAYKSSLTGNPLNTTPFLKQVADQGVFFERFFTPHTGTARGVFATLTGLPDVDLRNTSSRNPAAVDQHSLVNALIGYDKHYFIGGSTTWANVRGVIQKNIQGVQIREEGSFASPVVDVWGISDKSLFLEANAVLRQSTKPFFAVIQTAGNHRPYTVPETDTDFEKRQVPIDELKNNGFFSLDEFNAFRYMDYSVQKFFEAARQEKYFDNTIFVFLGDHGIAAQGHHVGPHMGRAFQDLKLSAVHTPLIIYAPKHLKPQRVRTIGSQIDVMPTILGLTDKPVRVQALGRDLLDPRFDDRRYAFTVYHDGVGEIGILDGERYYVKKANAKTGSLHALDSANPAEDLTERESATADKFNRLLDDYYQTAMYMLTHNRQRLHPGQQTQTAQR
jgi:phosphoglycerol transferase MdoB-like AlkP superfamily enzyme